MNPERYYVKLDGSPLVLVPGQRFRRSKSLDSQGPLAIGGSRYHTSTNQLVSADFSSPNISTCMTFVGDCLGM